MDIVENGVYSLAEAARYVATSPNRLRYWFKDGNRNLFESDYRDSDLSQAISFYDLIDSLVVVQFRNFNVTMKHIREVRDYYSDKWDTPHPFCMEKFYVDSSKKRILEEIRKADQSRLLVDALRGQGEIEECIAEHLREVDFSSVTDMAMQWRIAKGISITPGVQFGKPVISGTRITTKALASQFYANGKDKEFVAKLYKITPSQVIDALNFESTKGTVKNAA